MTDVVTVYYPRGRCIVVLLFLPYIISTALLFFFFLFILNMDDVIIT
jgi:hypothetical protein